MGGKAITADELETIYILADEGNGLTAISDVTGRSTTAIEKALKVRKNKDELRNMKLKNKSYIQRRLEERNVDENAKDIMIANHEILTLIKHKDRIEIQLDETPDNTKLVDLLLKIDDRINKWVAVKQGIKETRHTESILLEDDDGQTDKQREALHNANC